MLRELLSRSRISSGSSSGGLSTSAKATSGQTKSLSTEVDSALKSICVFDLSDGFLTVLYIFLFLWCLRLLRENRRSWWTGQNTGLLWYLGCTSLLCVCRFIGFALVPFASSVYGCNDKYQTFQWELDGSGDMHASLHLGLLVLSTASSALFFSSYSYFAHSLSKVLDILTSDGDADDGTSVLSKATKYSLLLFVLNVVVWGSIVLLWLVRLLFFAQAQVVDSLAQLAIGMAALTTCFVFALHFLRAFFFLRRSDGTTDDRVAQLSSILKLRRVLGVCRVCTLCFAIRAVLLMTRTTLGPVWEDVYFLLAEVLPTAYMLFTFQRSADPYDDDPSAPPGFADDAIEFGLSDPLQEFEELKESLMRLGGGNGDSRGSSSGPGSFGGGSRGGGGGWAAAVAAAAGSVASAVGDAVGGLVGALGMGLGGQRDGYVHADRHREYLHATPGSEGRGGAELGKLVGGDGEGGSYQQVSPYEAGLR